MIVGCEPASLDEGIGLSQPVADAIDAAVDLCTDVLIGVLAELLAQAGLEPAGLEPAGKDNRT